MAERPSHGELGHWTEKRALLSDFGDVVKIALAADEDDITCNDRNPVSGNFCSLAPLHRGWHALLSQDGSLLDEWEN